MTLNELALNKLSERGVKIKDLADLVYLMQKDYDETLTMENCEDALYSVIKKREVIHTILTGIGIDEAAENGLFQDEVNKIITDDEPLYGLDEILALSIVNVYGSIALTNFGYLDKEKPGIIGKLDKHHSHDGRCHTYLDDIAAALVAAAISRIAHNEK